MIRLPSVVYLVGAGPGDPELITVRGLSVLRNADVVLYDRLVAKELLLEAPQGAELIDVGKKPGGSCVPQIEINTLLIDRAKRGLTVVRLKGGDPFIFGRGAEEVLACREAGVRCSVVPGVSSALAAPASVGVPLTHRGTARSLMVVSGHGSDGKPTGYDYKALAAVDTLVILMGRRFLGDIAEALIDAGKAADTPTACIQEATTPNQRSVFATLGTIADSVEIAGLQAPMVTLIGPTAAMAEELALTPVEGASLVDQIKRVHKEPVSAR